MKHKKDVSNTENDSNNLTQNDSKDERTSISNSSLAKKNSDIKPKRVQKTDVAEEVKLNSKTETVANKHQSERTKETFKNDTKKVHSVVENTSSKIKDAVNNSKESISQARSESGLSLLWIVILVVLILWLLGFLVGLGDIIHLLLVVALILLILWLLGVI